MDPVERAFLLLVIEAEILEIEVAELIAELLLRVAVLEDSCSYS
jgi:hypothetical protein